MEYGWNFTIFVLKKWSRKNIFEIPQCGSHFLLIQFTSKKGGFLHKFSNSIKKWRSLHMEGMVNETVIQKNFIHIPFLPGKLRLNKRATVSYEKNADLIFLLLNRFPDIATQWMFRQELEKWSKKTVHFCLVCNACFTTTMYVVARKWIEFKYPLQKSLLE